MGFTNICKCDGCKKEVIDAGPPSDWGLVRTRKSKGDGNFRDTTNELLFCGDCIPILAKVGVTFL